MVDFTKFLSVGIDAAKVAERNRAEINAVFAVLNEQLGTATSNAVAIERRAINEPVDILAAATSALFNRKQYWALVVTSPANKSEYTEIARWSADTAGYPCSIGIAGETWTCTDRSGLEAALSELLQKHNVGEAIYQRMRAAANPGQERRAAGADADLG